MKGSSPDLEIGPALEKLVRRGDCELRFDVLFLIWLLQTHGLDAIFDGRLCEIASVERGAGEGGRIWVEISVGKTRKLPLSIEVRGQGAILVEAR